MYIERLLEQTAVMLTFANWRSVVVVALLVASKVWEDVHPWNADFADCLQEVAGIRYRPRALYDLESLFLDKLEWRVFVDGELYASYFFALLEDRKLPRKVRSGLRTRFRKRMHTEPLTRFAPIIEDMPYLNSDFGDLEAATASRHSHRPRHTVQSMPWAERGKLDDAQDLTMRTLKEVWRLDAKNPLLGAFRHAPRALAPSRFIQQSAELLLAHELATRTSEVMGPPKSGRLGSAATLSGATGEDLASEIRSFLGRQNDPPPKVSGSVPSLEQISALL